MWRKRNTPPLLLGMQVDITTLEIRLAIINRAPKNIVAHVSLLYARESSEYMPRSGFAESFRSEVPSFLRNRQTDFQSGCTNLQPHQQWRSVPLSPHPRQHLLSPEFLILAILTGIR